MTASEAREQINVFGELHANGDVYPKWLHGKITEVDRTMICFEDVYEHIHLFKTAKVVSFTPKEFKTNER